MFVLKRVFTPRATGLHLRAMSSLVNVSFNQGNGIAKLEMNNLPVNALSTKLMEDIISGLDEVKKQNCRGTILASGAKTTFSAGLDLSETYNSETTSFRKYYYLFQELMYQLYSAPFLVSAAMNGHSPAGGCVMALCADYRVMVNNAQKPFRIGLNESALGMVAPVWIQQLMTDVIGKRQAIQALLSASLFTTEEAFRVGLIDEMATDAQDAVEKAESYLTMYRNMPIHALVQTKQANRKEFIQKFKAEREFDLLSFSNTVLSPVTQGIIGAALESVKGKGKK